MLFFNTLTRTKTEFTPIKPGSVGVYSCGPTVYWNQHIGNMYAYIQWDLLIRTLKLLGYQVKWVMNITDVGHMTSDQDLGEDKMEKGARREHLSVWQLANKYIAQFLDSVNRLNITRPDILCRATEHIEDQINLIRKIEANGFSYKTQTGLVFDTGKFPDYPKFAHLDLSKQQAGTRIEVDPEKKRPWDFLLWVTSQPTHIMQWDSPWGRGFPGWHIECTAMSTKYLGETFDIHTGGTEHIPIHHTNEIAQGYGAFGHPTANFWLHNAWLLLKGEKIAKSLGNIYLVSDLVEKGYDPLAFRYLVLTSHYRQGMDFTWPGLDAAQSALRSLRQLMAEWQSPSLPPRSTISPEKLDKQEEFRAKFRQALEDDLAIPQALAVVWSAAKSNLPPADKRDLLLDFDEVLGLKLNETRHVSLQEINLPKAGKSIFTPIFLGNATIARIEQRELARQSGDFTTADKLREEIKSVDQINIKDTAKGTVIVPITPTNNHKP